MTNKMTDGEKMVWAAAFAVNLDSHGTAIAMMRADGAVADLRRTQHELSADSEPSDVEAALVALCTDSAVTFHGFELRREIERRIGRQLRGGK